MQPPRPGDETVPVCSVGSVMQALHGLGFVRPRYWSGYVIAKEPRSGPLYWHQDWPFWDDTVSADPLPHQLFLMWYLVDTRPENGCLRLLPRSHRLRCDVHDAIGTGHDDTVRHDDPFTSPAYQRHPDEVDVPVRAGDLVIGDARLLHAAHGNSSDRRRTVITMWYLPRYEELSEPMRAAFQTRLFAPPTADLACRSWPASVTCCPTTPERRSPPSGTGLLENT